MARADVHTSFWSATWRVLSVTAEQWSQHRTARLGAALAYYSVFSMGPLLLIVTSIAGLLFGADAVRGQLIAEFRGLLGETGAKALEAMLAGASSETSGRLTAITGVALLLFAALGVVVQLKDALNTIWNVEETAEPVTSWYLRTYAGALLGVLALGFLLTTSLVVTAALNAIGSHFGGSKSSALHALNWALSLAVLTTMFALLFKWFPDTRVAWRNVWIGAIATSLLFNLGRSLIGWYVGSQAFESTYGAAASIVVLLVWVYYSAQIVLLGAELTHAYAHERGSRREENAAAESKHSADLEGSDAGLSALSVHRPSPSRALQPREDLPSSKNSARLLCRCDLSRRR